MNLTKAVAAIKRGVARYLTSESIEAACRAEGHCWRQRDLGPARTLQAFLLQVLHGNAACSHVVRLADLSCSPSAYCQSRKNLPTAVYQRLLDQTSRAAGRSAIPSWRGHRTFLVDGSGFSMPDTKELQEHFGQPGGQQEGCGFPVAHWLTLFDAQSGLLVKQVAAPLRTHDLSQVAALHPELKTGDILVGDTAFASYAHLALLIQGGRHGLFRPHQRQLISFRRDRKLVGKLPKGTTARFAGSRLVRKLGKYDQLVEYQKPPKRPTWMSETEYAALPEKIVVRELRYATKVKGGRTSRITLVTTLLDPRLYPAAALAALYGVRWTVETNLGHLKTTMGMDVLHSQSVEGVLKEMIVFALVYNLVRLVMLAAAERQQAPLKRISFVDALRWLMQACRMEEDQPPLRLVVYPKRKPRQEPRVKKRRQKEYDLMKLPRCKLRQRLYTQIVAA
jgi:hypothetical protein